MLYIQLPRSSKFCPSSYKLDNLRPDLKEDLAHLVQDIRRRVCGTAIAVSPSF